MKEKLSFNTLNNIWMNSNIEIEIQNVVKELKDFKIFFDPLSLTKNHIENLTKLEKGLNSFMIKLNKIIVALNKQLNLKIDMINKKPEIPIENKIQLIAKTIIYLDLTKCYISNLISRKYNLNSSAKYFSLEFIFKLLEQSKFYIFKVWKDSNLIKQFYKDCLCKIELIYLKSIDDKVNPSFLGSGGSAKVYLATYNGKRATLKLYKNFVIGDCISRLSWIKSEISFAQDYLCKYFQQELNSSNLFFLFPTSLILYYLMT